MIINFDPLKAELVGAMALVWRRHLDLSDGQRLTSSSVDFY